jgi:hypothetical protein
MFRRSRSATRYRHTSCRCPWRMIPILRFWRLVSFIHKPSPDSPFSPTTSLEPRDRDDNWYSQTSRHQARNIALPIIRRVGHREEDQRPPRNERKIETVHETRRYSPELQIVAGEVCHPRIPESLWRVSRAEKVESEKVSPVGSGIGDQDCTAENEGEAYEERTALSLM